MAKATLITPSQNAEDVELLAEQTFGVKVKWRNSLEDREGEKFDFWTLEGPVGGISFFENDIDRAKIFWESR